MVVNVDFASAKMLLEAEDSVELKIKDVGGVPERSFKWNLK